MRRNNKGQFISGDKINGFVNFTEKEKYDYAISKGFTYDELTGNILKEGKIIKNKQKQGYIVIQVYENRNNKHTLFAHRFAWYYKHKEIPNVIDHINMVKDDNRIINLRNITQKENMWNKKSKGCHYDKNCNKWQSRISINKKRLFLGYFNTEEEAHNAYLEAKKIHHKIGS